MSQISLSVDFDIDDLIAAANPRELEALQKAVNDAVSDAHQGGGAFVLPMNAHQAEDSLHAVRLRDADALMEIARHLPEPVPDTLPSPVSRKLAELVGAAR